MTQHYYFAYGSNMNPERVQRRAMLYTDIELAILKGYRLAFNKKSVKYPGMAAANVMQEATSQVEGLLYHLVDQDQILTMDPFEGYPVRYDRHLIEMETTSGNRLTWVYIANTDFIEEGLQPAAWYLRHLLCGRPWLSSAYVQRLEGTECLPDTEIES